MRQLRIFVADDNVWDQKLISLALKNSPQTDLLCVGDGMEAVDFLLQRDKYVGADRPDLVILDLNLPKRSGLEILGQIRSEPALKSLPVVLFTGAPATPEATELCGEEATFYVVKAMGLDRYFGVIRALEEYARSIVEHTEWGTNPLEKLRMVLKAA